MYSDLVAELEEIASRLTGAVAGQISWQGAERDARHGAGQCTGRVIVRSSSPLEGDPRWSGAFSSIAEVGPDEIASAVRSCWASAFAPDPLERLEACGMEPEQLELAVLIQPEIRPDAGGLARISSDGGEVTIDAVRGHPAAMLSGWAEASTTVRLRGEGWADIGGRIPQLARKTPSDRTECGDAGVTTATVVAVARMVSAVREALGDDVIEWAVVGDRVWLLQSGRSQSVAQGPQLATPPASAPDPTPAPDTPLGTSAPAQPHTLAAWPVVPGSGSGSLLYRRPHQPLPRSCGDIVLLVDRPVPALAPLLFAGRGGSTGRDGSTSVGPSVRAVISRGGPSGSHLAEVARALGVPMVTGCPAEGVTGPPDQLSQPETPGAWHATVDGHRGEVTLTQDSGTRNSGTRNTDTGIRD
jgi:pyruvate,water dikinase